MHQVNAIQTRNAVQEDSVPKMIVKMNALQGYAYVSLVLFYIFKCSNINRMYFSIRAIVLFLRLTIFLACDPDDPRVIDAGFTASNLAYYCNGMESYDGADEYMY